MSDVIVKPEIFTKVFFNLPEVLATCESARQMVPGTAQLGVATVEVDEEMATNRVRIVSTKPLVFDVHSGAFEDTTTPRTFSVLQTQINMARLWFEATDRADETFGAPDLEFEIPKEARGAWDIYCYGRVARLGLRMHKPRYLYNFHNWVGFSDDATDAFDQLWAGVGLRFGDLERIVSDLVPTRTI